MPGDVALVQHLIIERYKVTASKSARASGIEHVKAATGQMNTLTAFEIYWAGEMASPRQNAELISSARGGNVNCGGGMWTISYLNFKLFKHVPKAWQNLPMLCSGTLKTELLNRAMP